MTAAHRWLRERITDAPAELLQAMLDALPGEEGSIAEALASASLTLYARVLASGGGREVALPLLAADALLTHAVEAQAEECPEQLADFVNRWGAAGRLGELMQQVEA